MRSTVDQFQDATTDETTAETSDAENAKTARRTKHKRVFEEYVTWSAGMLT